MLILGREIDDFKTERKGILAPLPMILRLVPILFYGALLFLIVVGSAAYLHRRVAEARRDAVLKDVSELKKKIETYKAERSALEAQIREATDLELWVLASMPLQPLVMSIIRSMTQQSSIVNLTLERDAETPSQLRMNLRINADSDEQLERSLEAIREMDYREFSPTQTRVREDLDYRASLLWQNPHTRRQLPEERMGAVGTTEAKGGRP